MGLKTLIFVFMVVLIFGGVIWLAVGEARKNGAARKKSSPLTVFFLILLCIAAFAFLFSVIM